MTVVVPWRDPGCPHRRAAHDWWHRHGFEVVEADCDGDWNKPRALNQTIARLDTDLLIVADADVFINRPERLRTIRGGWLVPHDRTVRLNQQATIDLYAGRLPDRRRAWKIYRSVAGGGMFVISRAGWDAAGGMDETFTGWGCEDQAFAVAADTLAGPHRRLPGPLWHLWHPPGLRKKDPTYAPNRARLGLYRTARGDRNAMRRLTDVDRP